MIFALICSFQSTSTPGLSGDERRSELMKRLMNSICRDESEEVGEGAIDEIVQVLAEEKVPKVPPSRDNAVVNYVSA